MNSFNDTYAPNIYQILLDSTHITIHDKSFQLILDT